MCKAGRLSVQLDCGNGHSLRRAILRVHWDTVPTGECCPTVATGLLDCDGKGLSCLD